MALAYNSSAQGGANGDSLTFAHTCTGANVILFVGVTQQRNTGAAGQDDVTGVTYNGSAMTRINTLAGTSFSGRLYLYYILIASPDGNAHNVVISENGGTSAIRGCSSSYTGAKQSAQPDSQITDYGASPNTTTITTVANMSWCVLIASSNASLGASTGSTERQAISGVIGIYDSNGPKTPAGANNMIINGGAAGVDTCAASFSPEPITISISETITMTESYSTLRKIFINVTETITMCRVFIGTVTDTITVSEVLQKLKIGFKNIAKATSSWTNKSKNTSSWTDKNKTDTTWDNQEKS